MSTPKVQARQALQQLIPYSPGKPIWEVQRELGLETVVKLASNENPLGPSVKALDAIRATIGDLHRYPDAHSVDLRGAIADKYELSPDQIIVTNGGDELITLVSEAFLDSGDEIVVPSPTFSEYEFGGTIMQATVKAVPLKDGFQYDADAIIQAVTDRTKIIYLCSPNNPTGTILLRSELQKILDSIPKSVLVVLDTAYRHYVSSDDYSDGLEYVKAGYPVIVLNTFSKIYGLAGIRVGFGVSSQEIIRSILQVKEPFNVNALAQVAAIAALGDDEHVRLSSQLVQQERQRMYPLLAELGLGYTESMSNFLLIAFNSDAGWIIDELMKQGVIVRAGKAWGLPNHIRVSIGLPSENDSFIEKLREILAAQ